VPEPAPADKADGLVAGASTPVGVVMRAMVWLGMYLALVLAPVIALLLGPTGPGLGFLWDLSAALGFSALAMMGVQSLLTARFRRATAP
jgi:predicted ferric reductase